MVLDFVMAYMEFLTSNLEATAHPILDSIVHKARSPPYAYVVLCDPSVSPS